MIQAKERPFSTSWVVISVLLFMAMELVLGSFVGDVICGKYFSRMLALRMQVVLSLGAYFIGGFTIGVISPGIRLWEPAIAAAISVALTLLYAVFVPNVFMQMTTGKLFIGGVIAFCLALAGAYFGEKLMGNIRK